METFEQVVEQFSPMISAVMRKANIYKNQDHFRQCALIALWRAWEKYDATRGDFAPYAYQTMLTTMYTELTRDHRHEVRCMAVEHDTLVHMIQQAHEQHTLPLLETLREHVSAEEWQLLVDLYVHHYSYEELAERLCISVAALRKRRDRLIKRLRETMR